MPRVEYREEPCAAALSRVKGAPWMVPWSLNPYTGCAHRCTFEPLPGEEGEWCASPHSKRQLEVIADLKRIYGLDLETHAIRNFPTESGHSERQAK